MAYKNPLLEIIIAAYQKDSTSIATVLEDYHVLVTEMFNSKKNPEIYADHRYKYAELYAITEIKRKYT